jgi:hypothetical protein
MTENDSFIGSRLIVGSKIVSREGAAIQVEEITLSQAWHDGMARAIEQGREDARKRTLSYQLKKFFSDLLSRNPNRSNGG